MENKHAHGGLINGNGLDAFRVFKIGNGIANLEVFDPQNSADLTGIDLIFDFFLSQSFKNK
jgi:hypothetical protein